MTERHFIIDEHKQVLASTKNPELAQRLASATRGRIIFGKENNALHKAKQESK